MNTDEITPVVITFNEEPNIARCLAGLAWARRILVIDSGSTDATLDICARFPQVEVVHRAFDSFAGQCNFALGLVQTGWVLSCDADYIAGPDFLEELRRLPEDGGIGGWSARFIYSIGGRDLRGGLYPPRTVLYRREGAVYENDGHGHRVKIPGPVQAMQTALRHDDRKPLGRWISSQLKYAAQEAEKLAAAHPAGLGWPDKLRRTGWAAPVVMGVYCLVWKRGLLDGWPGWFYAAQRIFAELLLCLHLVDRRLGGGEKTN